jgi:release factor glutamine methyltransferase
METKAVPDLTITEAIQQATGVFEIHSESARLDAGVLLGHILGRSRTWIAAHPDSIVNVNEREELGRLLKEAAVGVPLPYLVGHQEFYGLDFFINRDVLIPRPETELLVDLALRWFEVHPGRRLAADIGTGSGCIAISLAVNTPELMMYASDISNAALEVARQNIRKHQVEKQIRLSCSDLIDTLPEAVDVLCANLPYIPEARLDGLTSLRHEPRQALSGGQDGLQFIRQLLVDSPGRIRQGGMILLEIEASLGPQVISLARNDFPGALVNCHRDLAGNDRIVSIELS